MWKICHLSGLHNLNFDSFLQTHLVFWLLCSLVNFCAAIAHTHGKEQQRCYIGSTKTDSTTIQASCNAIMKADVWKTQSLQQNTADWRSWIEPWNGNHKHWEAEEKRTGHISSLSVAHILLIWRTHDKSSLIYFLCTRWMPNMCGCWPPAVMKPYKNIH